jgi:hypothetical protein
MGKLTPNAVIGILRGKLGDLVFVPAADGTVIVKHRPVRKAEFTQSEKGNQSRFRKASAYVKFVRQQPGIYAFYQTIAKLTGKRPCDLAHADFFHPPVIQDVDLTSYTGRAGDLVQVHATDSVGVSGVSITIAQLDGLLLEHGEAQPGAESLRWVYLAQRDLSPGQTVLVHTIATDRLGNKVTKSVYQVLR